MAIKVSNTEVISDSRGLNNIVSIDATTAATIGAASGGGQTTLVNADVSISQVATILLPIGDYRINRYVIEGLQTQHFFGDIMLWRMTDSSGSTITTTDYIAMQGQANSTNKHSQIDNEVPSGFNFDVPSTSQSGSSSGWYAEINVFNGYSSSKRTVTSVICSSTKRDASNFQFSMDTTQRNQHIVLRLQQGNDFTATGSYTHWGIS